MDTPFFSWSFCVHTLYTLQSISTFSSVYWLKNYCNLVRPIRKTVLYKPEDTVLLMIGFHHFLIHDVNWRGSISWRHLGWCGKNTHFMVNHISCNLIYIKYLPPRETFTAIISTANNTTIHKYEWTLGVRHTSYEFSISWQVYHLLLFILFP